MAGKEDVISIQSPSLTGESTKSVAAAPSTRLDLSVVRAIAIVRIMAGLTLVLIALGGYVRATGAGLSCPDWPLCFGRVIPPDFGSGVAQEVTHRVAASAVALGYLGLLFFSFRSRRDQPKLFRWTAFVGLLLIVQIVFGGLTVLMKLNPFVVTTHLALGTTLFQTLAILSLEKSRPKIINPDDAPPRRFAPISGGVKTACWLVAILIVTQILVGGFVGSSGASMACPDAPLCNGQVLPANASGPVLLQVSHRAIGILIAASLFFLFLNLGSRRSLQMHTFGMLFLVGIQISIGIANVNLQIPAFVTILHLIVAQLILFGTIVLVRRTSDLKPIVDLTSSQTSSKIPSAA